MSMKETIYRSLGHTGFSSAPFANVAICTVCEYVFGCMCGDGYLRICYIYTYCINMNRYERDVILVYTNSSENTANKFNVPMQRYTNTLLTHWGYASVALKHRNNNYRKVSNIRGTLVGNKVVDHSDVVGASPVGAAPTTSSFST